MFVHNKIYRNFQLLPNYHYYYHYLCFLYKNQKDNLSNIVSDFDDNTLFLY